MTEPQITGHISKRFDQELEDIHNKVLSMGGLVENQVANGIRSLVQSDSELARKVIADDHKVNRMEVEIDEECVHILARRQPAAGDLRLIVAVIKTITDLERIGDQAEKLGRIQLELEQQEISSSAYIKLEHLGELVAKILHSTLDAFARMNVADAMATMELDNRVNDEYDGLMREMITHMMEDPRTIRSSLRISWCARALERIGDHAKNICEYVVFLVQGKDVRHITPKDQPGL
ncbi:MAG TPA: phosphate signaling complex protein PhoU [Gammaproteobacteria bacterium]|jgi:phosphate transport system protein